jgi:hypothetical protein
MTPLEVAEKHTILRSTVGSTIHRLHLEGTDDRDEMGVAIEPPELALGLQRFDHYQKRDRPEGVKSEPGDLDLIIYSLRKFVGLAAAGNPSILILLYAPPLFINEWGVRLLENKHLFASKSAGPRFLGYMKQQKERLLGTRGQMRVTRTDLIEKHGFDTKYAMHMLRLGFQGREFLTMGELRLPPDPSNVDMAFCRKVREGRSNFEDVIKVTEQLEEDLKKLLVTSPLPRVPDFKAIDKLLVGLYETYWWANNLSSTVPGMI